MFAIIPGVARLLWTQNINTFWSLTHARVVITDSKDEYHHHRRHSALGYQTPASYVAACTHR